jgi:hypothetical protein
LKQSELLAAQNIISSVLYCQLIPNNGKDISDFIANGGNVEELLNIMGCSIYNQKFRNRKLKQTK